MKSQDCPGCGEKNPLEVVMCWACFTPLASTLPARVRIWQLLKTIGIRLYNALHSKRTRSELNAQNSIADEPIVRIFHTILEYAVADSAEVIRIEPQAVDESLSRGTSKQAERHRTVFGPANIGVRILYRIDNEMQEQMKVPGFVLAPLVSLIRSRSSLDASTFDQPQNGSLLVALKDGPRQFGVDISPSPIGDVVLINLR